MDIKAQLTRLLSTAGSVAQKTAPVLNPVSTLVAKAVADHFHPAPAPGAQPAAPPTPPVPAVPARLRATLTSEQAARLDDALSGKQGTVAQGVARAAVAQASVLPEPQAAKLLSVATLNPAGPEGAAVASILSSPAWLAAKPDQKRQLLEVMTTASPKGLTALAELSKGNRLADTDKNGQTLLSNLSTLSTQEMPSFGPARKTEVVDEVLQHAANPAAIHQSVQDTCTATTIQYELARTNPSEYARVMAGLVGPEGKATMRGGDVLTRKEGALLTPAGDTRGFASQVFQASAMEYGNGRETYDPRRDVSGAGRKGLKEEEEVKLAKQLLGLPKMNWYPVKDNAGLVDGLAALSKDANAKPVILNFNIGKNFGHACAFVKVEGDRVYFRNPDPGPTSRVPGARIENEKSGLQSMSVEDFKKHCDSVAASAA